MERIRILDTTLRDGEQAPGAGMNIPQKVRMAEALARLRVDTIEAGFPAASDGDFEAVRAIARRVKGPRISALARAHGQDVDRAWEAVAEAGEPGLHVFIATSELHMRHKLRMTEEEVLARVHEHVCKARAHTPHVEFSAEDSTRTDKDFLVRVFQAALDAGAGILNMPDTVGYATPADYADLVRYVARHVRGVERAILSAHCHDDLGLAVANSLAAIGAGARQVECTVNGLGERAGNAAVEEIVMAMRTRPDAFRFTTGVDTRQLVPASKTLVDITGLGVPVNKAIVGENAFAHESGIHQDGVLKNPLTYEIITPESVGAAGSSLVLGKHSGRNAFRAHLRRLGYELDPGSLDSAFRKFKAHADVHHGVNDGQLRALMTSPD